MTEPGYLPIGIYKDDKHDGGKCVVRALDLEKNQLDIARSKDRNEIDYILVYKKM